MADAGLTRGGFYDYFRSKSDLYADTLDCFFTDPRWNNSWKGVEIDLKGAKVAPQIVRAYLSIHPALRGYRELLPNDRAAHRRGAEWEEGETGIRKGVPGNGQFPRA
jgi:AcrR family transcriptional regulator